MNLRGLLPTIIFIMLPVFGFSQEKAAATSDRKDPVKVVADQQRKADPARLVQENQQRRRADMVKSVPITNKTMDAIRMQNKKATMGQMHTINKAIRKSMTIHKRR
jgi:hypothetical protein